MTAFAFFHENKESPDYGREVEYLLKFNEDRILEAEKNKYGKFDKKSRFVPCDETVPMGRYIETKNVLEKEIKNLREEMENRTNVGTFFTIIFIGITATMAYKWHYQHTWQVDEASHLIYRSHPTLFGDKRYYYSWHKSRDGDEGWISVRKDGIPYEKDPTIVADDLWPR